jgi:hypothetical protein
MQQRRLGRPRAQQFDVGKAMALKNLNSAFSTPTAGTDAAPSPSNAYANAAMMMGGGNYLKFFWTRFLSRVSSVCSRQVVMYVF